ncbi:phosphatase and actin regulator 2 [Trichonephila clavipes]|nr:phosphatase and actin regulator 2 [Trichonephila clavipes]
MSGKGKILQNGDPNCYFLCDPNKSSELKSDSSEGGILDWRGVVLSRDERVSQNEREVTSEQKIELAKLQLAKLEKEIELQLAINKALSLNPAAKVEEKQFETNIENMIKCENGNITDLDRRIYYTSSVYAEIEKLGHAKSDVLLNESESSLGAHACAYSCGVSFPNVSVSNVIENSSYDLPYVKNSNTRNDSNSLIKDYKCNKIKITKLKLSIVREKCSDIVLCKKANGAMKTSSVEFISRSPNPLPMKSNYRRFVLLRRIFQPWQWKRRKKINRFEQTSRTLQRKISMRSTKDQLVEKDVLMPVKHNVFLWNLPDVEEMPSHDGETV